MADLFDAQNYQLQWLSAPYLVATLGLAAIGLYALVINGHRLLRASFLVCCASLALVNAAYGLASSAVVEPAAVAIHRAAASVVPLLATGILAFLVVHLQRVSTYGWLVIALFITSLGQLPFILMTDWYVAGVRESSFGMFHVHAGPLLPLLLLSLLIALGSGAALTVQQLRSGESRLRPQQLKRMIWAFGIFSLSSVDILLAYEVDWFPLSWLFAGVGTGMLFRALIADELIHARSLDYDWPVILAYPVIAGSALWLIWHVVGPTSPLLLALLSVTVFLVLRAGMTAFDLSQRSRDGAAADSPLERLADKYASTVQKLFSQEEIAEATYETIMVGLGCKDIDMILLSEHDWSWKTLDGEVLSEEASPDPLTTSWLLEHMEPLHRLDLPNLGLDDFREVIEELMDANVAEVLVPLVNRDAILGVLILGRFARTRTLTKEEDRFLSSIQEHLTSAMVYAQMHEEANEQVAIQKEVALAGSIQKAFASRSEIVDYGAVQVSGLWAPATQCGGDWWSVHKLPDGRVLVLVGDVTGHGVGAAMVTAAAKGCYDVVQRLRGDDLKVVDVLHHLDATVRLVGGNHFNMTCFATLLDPANGQVTFANAGHVPPYLCSPKEGGGIELGSLVARGNPLGAGDAPVYQERTRALHKHDILIWYTDGIVECANAQQQQYGDRRMQRLLRKIDKLDPNPRTVRDHIIRAVAAFQGGVPPDDDITLVVGRVV